MYKWSCVLLLIFFNSLHGQTTTKNLDLIIVIDENIAVGSISGLSIKTTYQNKDAVIEGNYYPGNLSIKNDDYLQLMSNETKNIHLEFNYYEYIKGKQSVYNYEIEIKKEWLSDNFNILHIYNLSKKKYKEKFEPSGKNQNYVYELDSPTHTFKLIQKKKQ